MILYCTLCGKPLRVLEIDCAEANLICPAGHKWWYSPVALDKGDIIAVAVELGFQCDIGQPIAGLEGIGG